MREKGREKREVAKGKLHAQLQSISLRVTSEANVLVVIAVFYEHKQANRQTMSNIKTINLMSEKMVNKMH